MKKKKKKKEKREKNEIEKEKRKRKKKEKNGATVLPHSFMSLCFRYACDIQSPAT